MVVRKRILKDLRINARIHTLLDCRFIHEDITYNAVLMDLSQKGALLSSDFLPPTGGNIALIIQSTLIKKDLLLSGKVSPGERGKTEQGRKGRFVVQFDQTPLDLINLITKSHSIQKENEAQLNDW